MNRLTEYMGWRWRWLRASRFDRRLGLVSLTPAERRRLAARIAARRSA